MVIAGASCTLDVATTILDCIQLQAHMYVSNSSNQCRQAAALCNQAEDWGVYIGDLGDSLKKIAQYTLVATCKIALLTH